MFCHAPSLQPLVGKEARTANSSGLSVILEINRDFPYQVALSFDEIAMEVLAWLDSNQCRQDDRVLQHGVALSGNTWIAIHSLLPIG